MAPSDGDPSQKLTPEKRESLKQLGREMRSLNPIPMDLEEAQIYLQGMYPELSHDEQTLVLEAYKSTEPQTALEAAQNRLKSEENRLNSTNP